MHDDDINNKGEYNFNKIYNNRAEQVQPAPLLI
jgi:hypothetical protein